MAAQASSQSSERPMTEPFDGLQPVVWYFHPLAGAKRRNR
jgi:hypothetical protein